MTARLAPPTRTPRPRQAHERRAVSACKHPNPQWSLADCNEDGWKCGDCDKQLGDEGFSPTLDREQTAEKVGVILLFLSMHSFMYVSNNTQGDGMTADVVKRCHAENTFDQQSIVKFLVESNTTHAQFWREQAKQGLCAHPSREQSGDTLKCHACGHELKTKAEHGPLFGEPF